MSDRKSPERPSVIPMGYLGSVTVTDHAGRSARLFWDKDGILQEEAEAHVEPIALGVFSKMQRLVLGQDEVIAFPIDVTLTADG